VITIIVSEANTDNGPEAQANYAGANGEQKRKE